MLFENVNNTMLFSIISFLYMMFFGIIFIIKRKIKSTELSIFKAIVFANIICLISECFLVFLIMSKSDIIGLSLKIFNVCLFTYVWLIGLYTYIVIFTNEEDKKNTIKFKLYGLFYILVIIGLLILPAYLNDVAYMQ